ncbi:hypothetical protein [Sphingomonas sp. 22R3R2A-7]|uniref:hypothetical protein n=1 Tax=Sphingomonas sp. 22R3R2A-7 TaxID=3050230 RepID=UPI002FE16D60
MNAFNLLAAPALALTFALAACSKPAPETRSEPVATSAGATETTRPEKVVAPQTRDLSGRWIGVEGMVLDITPAAAPGRFRLAMQWDLDNKGEFDGQAVGDTIVFTRGGVREILRPTDGDATGLKYLAGKTDCLTVKTGEGYCRDGSAR